jgi:hypothetical protein
VDNKSARGSEGEKHSQKMEEQNRNLYENKGPVFRSRIESGNVTENKDSYRLKSGNVVEKKHVNRKARVTSRPDLWYENVSSVDPAHVACQ